MPLVAMGLFWEFRHRRPDKIAQEKKIQQLENDNRILRDRLDGLGPLMGHIIVETDSHGLILFKAGSWHQLDQATQAHEPAPEFLTSWIHALDRDLFQDYFRSALVDGPQQAGRFRLSCRHDGACLFEFTAQPVHDQGIDGGQGLRFVLREVNAGGQLFPHFQQDVTSEEILTLVLRSFVDAGREGLESALLNAMDSVARLLGADFSLLVRRGGPEEPLETVSVWREEGFCPLSDPEFFLSLAGCSGLRENLKPGHILHLSDRHDMAESDGFCPEVKRLFGLRSLVCLPMALSAEREEILVFGTRDPAVRWREVDLKTLEVLTSFYNSALLREQERQMLEKANRKFESIVEFLPDPTFVINRHGEVVAWNRAMAELTGTPKAEILGQGDHAHAVPFYGEPVPTLINHFSQAEMGEWRHLYDFVEVHADTVYAECFAPRLNDGDGAFLWSTASALCDDGGQVIGAIQSLRDVTYRKKSEHALRSSEEGYRHLVETMNDGMGVVSAAGTITYANDSLCQMMRMDKDSLQGANIMSLVPILGEVEQLSTWRGWKLAPGEALELDVPRADGTSFPARVSPAAISDEHGNFQGGFGIVSDLTTIREAEASIRKVNENLEQRVADSTRELRATNSALRESEARFRRIIDSLQEGYVFYSQNKDRGFTYISPSYRNLTGFKTPADLCEGVRQDILLESNAEARHMAEKSLSGFRQSPFDLEVTCADGSIRTMEIMEVPIFDEFGHVTSVEGIGRDVTEARRNLQLVREAQAQLIEQEKLAALGSLVAGLSHEINTPVGIGVTASSHLVAEVGQCIKQYEEGNLTQEDFESFLETSRESADLVVANLNRAADLIQNFKQVASDQANSMERVFVLKEYLEDVVRSFSPRLRKSGFNIVVDCRSELKMKCDPGSLYQVLSNLIVNSLNHGFEGMLVGQITISVHTSDTDLIIEFADNGNGMSRQESARIYEPFFTTKRGRGGTGLGLHIVYNNVTQNMGGNITCASKPGRGTKFTISVPLLAEVEHG